MNKENLILVIGHKSSLSSSLTLSSITDSLPSLDCSIIYWNNGLPKLSDEIDGLRIINSIDNMSLSRIYNIILKLEYDRTLIFDNDTKVTKDYLESALKIPKEQFGLPIVKSSLTSQIVSPAPYQDDDDKIVLNKHSTFITSGIVVGKYAKLQLMHKKAALFDERFTFYGIDTMLSRMLAKHGSTVIRLPDIHHSLSREEPVQSKFHRQQRGIALGRLLMYGGHMRDKRMFIVILIKRLFKENALISVKSVFFSIRNDLLRKSKRTID